MRDESMTNEEVQIRKIDLLRKQREEQIEQMKTNIFQFIKYSLILALGLILLNFAWPLIMFTISTVVKVIAGLLGFLLCLAGVFGIGVLIFGKNKKVL